MGKEKEIIKCELNGKKYRKENCPHPDYDCITCPELIKKATPKQKPQKVSTTNKKNNVKAQKTTGLKKKKDKTPDKKTYERKIPIEGTLSKAGIDILFSISLTKENWQMLSLLYFEDDGRSAEQFYNDFYTSFMTPAKYTINKGIPGQHKGALFYEVLKVQAAILYKHFDTLREEGRLETFLKSFQIDEDIKNKNGKPNLNLLTMHCMKKVYAEWIQDIEKIFDSSEGELNFIITYINDGKTILMGKTYHRKIAFIRTILEAEKNKKYLKNRQKIDRYNNESIFKFVYDLMSSYRIF